MLYHGMVSGQSLLDPDKIYVVCADICSFTVVNSNAVQTCLKLIWVCLSVLQSEFGYSVIHHPARKEQETLWWEW